MGSGILRVGRLRGGSCSNNNGGNVVALAVARLGGGLREESMRVRAGDGGWWTTQQEGMWMMRGKQAGRGPHSKRGGADNARRAGGGRQDERTGAEATTQDSSGGLATRPPLCTAWGGHLSRHWVLHGGGDGTWSSYVVANRMQLVTCSSAGGPWASVPHEISFLVLFLTSGIEYVFY